MAAQHDRSRAQEARLAGRVGGQVAARSGAGWFRKADVRSGRFLYEMKRTDNKRSITIKFDDLKKVRIEASTVDRLPVLGFQLNDRNYIILQEEDFLELTGG